MTTEPLTEVSINEIRGDDVGNRVIVIRDGNAFDATLAEFWVTRSPYGAKKITARLKLATDGADVSLTNVPMDYLLQIERPAQGAPGMTEEEFLASLEPEGGE